MNKAKMARWLLLVFTTSFVVGCALKNQTSTNSNSQSDQNQAMDEGSSQIKLNVVKEVLPNGLTILISENKKLPIFTYYTYYKVGGKYEADGITGASHFLEHMMFKGAKKYGPGEFDKLIEGNGGKNNAFTTNDHTVYYESLPKEHLNTVIDLEADRMQNLLLEKVSFEKERQVVLEERKMRYENSDRGKLYLKMMKEVFKGTPYGTSVIGKIKDLKTVSRDQIWDYFKMHYAPNNAIIVIVGDIDAKKTLKEIKSKFASIPASKDLEKEKKSQLAKLGFDWKAKFNRSFNIKGQSPNPMFMIAYKGVEIQEDEGFVLDILSSILGGGDSSYLSQKFVLTKRPTLNNVFASNYTLQNSGVFFVGGELLSKKSLNASKKNIYKAVAKSCKEAITPRALEKVKNQFLVDQFHGLDTNAGIARFIGDREFYFGDYLFYKTEMQKYNSVTIEQLKAACKKYLKRDRSLYFSIWNKNRG